MMIDNNQTLEEDIDFREKKSLRKHAGIIKVITIKQIFPTNEHAHTHTYTHTHTYIYIYIS